MRLVSSLLGLMTLTLTLTDVAIAALSSGCGKAPTITSGVKTITVDGTQRQFTIRVPQNYQNNKGYKLIYGLHWVGGRMDQVANGGDTGSKNWKYYGMQVLANETAIFVAPQGLNGGWANSGGSDLKFIDAMNNYIDSGLCVDQGQRFSIGFSYGGSMTYAIACARAKQFRAVSVIAGGVLSGCDGGNDPIAYFGIHGVRDGTLNIAGGRSMRDRFVKNNGCASMTGAKEPASGSRTHITTTATGCKTGYPVKWAAHDGGHIQAAADKPAPEENGEASWVGPEAWAFFNSLEVSTPK
ncbi:carbohydrate esterase family 1 protein [Periconia macrospinosa]|uniref:Feruloyl esterase C n=1 Tax=Periconia macrospinosa TaxID=97972 RepID=A0A2V1D1N3_9PLEO|nr:carbohydrate esterase family 1 protein [Periconia macrospinosa]